MIIVRHLHNCQTGQRGRTIFFSLFSCIWGLVADKDLLLFCYLGVYFFLGFGQSAGAGGGGGGGGATVSASFVLMIISNQECAAAAIRSFCCSCIKYGKSCVFVYVCERERGEEGMMVCKPIKPTNHEVKKPMHFFFHLFILL